MSRPGVDRTVSSTASPIPGGVASPNVAAPFPQRDATACHGAGGAVGVGRSAVETPDALTALRASVRHGHGRSVQVQCPNPDCRLPLLLVDDSAPSRDCWGYAQFEPAVYVIEDGEGYEDDPEMGALSQCPCCDMPLATDSVELRDREHVA